MKFDIHLLRAVFFPELSEEMQNQKNLTDIFPDLSTSVNDYPMWIRVLISFIISIRFLLVGVVTICLSAGLVALGFDLPTESNSVFLLLMVIAALVYRFNTIFRITQSSPIDFAMIRLIQLVLNLLGIKYHITSSDGKDLITPSHMILTQEVRYNINHELRQMLMTCDTFPDSQDEVDMETRVTRRRDDNKTAPDSCWIIITHSQFGEEFESVPDSWGVVAINPQSGEITARSQSGEEFESVSDSWEEFTVNPQSGEITARSQSGEKFKFELWTDLIGGRGNEK